MKNVKLIVGLSNPIIQYNQTRHNMGAWFIQNLAKFHNQILKKHDKFLGYIGNFTYYNSKVYLLIPNIFMNLNAQSILIVSKFYKIMLDEILVVHDELDLKPGSMRLKLGFGHNGHNGIRNIINVISKKNGFLRIQIGIGRPHGSKKISDFVLSSPLLEEKQLIERSILDAVKITNMLIKKNCFSVQHLKKLNQMINLR
ncbi:MAG: aminoacyl-tRNA hydrolase [Buchnera aphidicola (Nurudea shiraii)]